MIWFAWRQFRTSAFVILVGLLGVAILFGLTGPHMVHVYDATVKGCSAVGDCSSVTSSLISKYNKIMQFMVSLVLIFPAILGIFWGAPLIARELESGTYRLAWTQGVTRSRWIATKVLTGLVASVVAGGLFSWMFTWWASPIDTINANRFTSLIYDTHYLTPIGYCAFAYGLGVTAGVLWRRTVPAMASALVAYVAVRLVFTPDVRPHLMTPVTKTISALKSGVAFEMTPSGSQIHGGYPNIANAWIRESTLVAKSGGASIKNFIEVNCPKLFSLPPVRFGGSSHKSVKAAFSVESRVHDCIAKVNLHFFDVIKFQPASRFWTFQWYEMIIFLVAGLSLCAFSYWWLRRRIS